jgi:phthalate 4,5-cis-dihydrodiol dehydrogenase
MDDRRLGVGILGLGMAGGFMAPIIANHARVALVAAADLDPVLCERFAHGTGLPAVNRAEALFERADVDVVYIATPHQFHAVQAIAAMEAGKHVVVEKPMALSLADCDAMIETADRTGRVLIVGHTHGFDPAPRAIGEIVASRRYGPLAMITMINFTDFLYRPRRPEELDTSRGGGIFFNQLPHQVEIARVIAGEPVRSVRCVSGIMDPTRGTEGHLAALITFENGAVASIVYSGHDRFDSDEFHFNVGEIGYPKTASHGAAWRACQKLETVDAETEVRRDRYGYGSGAFRDLKPPPHQPHFGMLIASCTEADLRPSADGLTVFGMEGAQEISLRGRETFAGHVNVWNDCFDAIRGARPALHDGQFARTTLLVCQALLESAREGREVFL